VEAKKARRAKRNKKNFLPFFALLAFFASPLRAIQERASGLTICPANQDLDEAVRYRRALPSTPHLGVPLM
jgi:hypothetical protein